MNILVDTDLILEVFLNRNHLKKKAEKVWNYFYSGQANGYIHEVGLERIYLYIQKLGDVDTAEETICLINNVFRTLPVNYEILREAVSMECQDFESALEVVCAKKHNIDAILTQKHQDFKGTDYSIWSFEDLSKRQVLEQQYNNKASLEQMPSFHLDKNLNEIASEGNLGQIIFELIKKAQAQNWIEDLINAARRANPGNESLKNVAESLCIASVTEELSPEQERRLNSPNVSMMSREALVVGINSYSNEDLKLKAAAQDAQAVAQLLEEYGDFKVTRLPALKERSSETIKVCPNTQVTLKELKTAIAQLFKPKDNPPDTALLYFCGHGLREELGISEDFLATSNVNPDMDNWGVSLKWLRELLQESEVRQQIIILDCCYVGEVLNLAQADPGDRGKGYDRCFIGALRSFEVGDEEIDRHSSAFSGWLLKALEPEGNEWVTNYTLVNKLKQEEHHLSPQRLIFGNSGDTINLTRRSMQVSQNPTTPFSGICPYRGLRYFDSKQEDAKYFYGRTSLTDELLEKVRVGNFVAVLGASGSGKSSVVRAGLLYQLKLGQRLSGSEKWDLKILKPGEDPLKSLASVFLDSELSVIERASQLEKAEELIAKGADGLRLLVSSSVIDERQRLVLVIDQFEEVFTLCKDTAKRQQFFECLLGALRKTGNKLCLVLTMRSDFFGKCTEHEYSGLAQQIQQHGVTVMPMSRKELREAIVKPAKEVGLQIEPGLVEHIVAEVENAPGSLPLLEYTLTQLWEKRSDNCLRFATYNELGGIKGTLNKRATEVYESFSEKEQAVVQHIFLALTQLGEGTEDTRRRVEKGSLVSKRFCEEVIDAVIKRLADEKLVVTSEIEKEGISYRVAVVDVAHEALIHHWELLGQWIEENRDKLRKKRAIIATIKDLRGRGKVNLSGYDYSGSDLSYVDLSSVNFRHSNLSDVDFIGADLSDVDFSDANLSNANLSDANLEGAKLCDANLQGAQIFDAKLRGTEINEKTKIDDKFHLVLEIVKQSFEGEKLEGSKLDSAKKAFEFLKQMVENLDNVVVKELGNISKKILEDDKEVVEIRIEAFKFFKQLVEQGNLEAEDLSDISKKLLENDKEVLEIRIEAFKFLKQLLEQGNLEAEDLSDISKKLLENDKEVVEIRIEALKFLKRLVKQGNLEVEELSNISIKLLESDKEAFRIRLQAGKILKQLGKDIPMLIAEIKDNVESIRFIEHPLTEEIDCNGVRLEMVEIPEGTFLMGAPREEKESRDSERPQHEVAVAGFLMGKYAITQKQWEAVAALPQIERELGPNPSYFKGDNRPVEKVNWYEAVEFCARLSQRTGREFRLSSEAEWEYACRGGTTTAFHFGDTITTDLAKYSRKFGSTTPVDEFPGNVFGLYDMHGNVCEWCLDDWHGNYEGAPTDGSAWIKNDNDNPYQKKVLRGGSWDVTPLYCRSAFRNGYAPARCRDFIGFRVVCAMAQRILQ